MPLDIMLDLETLSTEPNAAIVQIGVAAFDPDGTEVDPANCREWCVAMEPGAAVDHATLRWWIQQSEAARRAVFVEHPYSLGSALLNFDYYCKCYPEASLWSHGDKRDRTRHRTSSWLESAYRSLVLTIPWDYRRVRDTRTLFWLAERRGWKRPQRDTAHTAMADAVAQALDVQSAMEVLR